MFNSYKLFEGTDHNEMSFKNDVGTEKQNGH